MMPALATPLPSGPPGLPGAANRRASAASSTDGGDEAQAFLRALAALSRPDGGAPADGGPEGEAETAWAEPGYEERSRPGSVDSSLLPLDFPPVIALETAVPAPPSRQAADTVPLARPVEPAAPSAVSLPPITASVGTADRAGGIMTTVPGTMPATAAGAAAPARDSDAAARTADGESGGGAAVDSLPTGGSARQTIAGAAQHSLDPVVQRPVSVATQEPSEMAARRAAPLDEHPEATDVPRLTRAPGAVQTSASEVGTVRAPVSGQATAVRPAVVGGHAGSPDAGDAAAGGDHAAEPAPVAAPRPAGGGRSGERGGSGLERRAPDAGLPGQRLARFDGDAHAAGRHADGSTARGAEAFGESGAPPAAASPRASAPGTASAAVGDRGSRDDLVSSAIAQIVARVHVPRREGRQELVLRLDPPGLGRLRIQTRLEGRELALEIRAEEETTRALLADTLPRLREALQRQGFVADRVTVESSLDDRGGTHTGGGAQPFEPAWGTAPRPGVRVAPSHDVSASVTTSDRIDVLV